MGLFADTDGQFHRAVDIVQSLPKGGPVQTSYEEKLWLYSLYKQATEGDISMTRPGMLDILGKAKWDAWNKQKGIDKKEAKRSYVDALLKILRKHGSLQGSQTHIIELESFDADIGSNETFPPRPTSPASSSSSYHSSQASPLAQPSPPEYNMLPPDPLLPPPDVAEDIVPPSALNSSHRSLLNLSLSQSQQSHSHSHSHSIPQPSIIEGVGGNRTNNVSHIGSRSHSLAGGPGAGTGRSSAQGDRDRDRQTGGSIHSFRQNQHNYSTSSLRNPNLSQQQQQGSYSPGLPAVSDFIHIHTPEMPPSIPSPYLGVHNQQQHIHGQTPITTYPSRLPGPGSSSTFNTQAAIPLNLSINLQNIQTSLSALHERLSMLERNQSIILRKNERKKQWFWNTTEEDELDQLEENELQHNNNNINRNSTSQRVRDLSDNSSHITVTRVKRRRGKLSVRVMWYLLTAVRRALVDVTIGSIIILASIIVLGGGWRRARWTLGVLQARFQRYLLDGL
ncbi:uncharacterized protein L201_003642 [Kwoniella dendrophila CBS 6074]|uniref:ACB domain-containing protein n=1 Tax=Kwoniella dendrophila CBS 6074 TaxID=1295534 RepID=A0AAX4JUZ1_9TREE